MNQNKAQEDTERQSELLQTLKRSEQKRDRKRQKTDDGKEHLYAILKKAMTIRYLVGIDMSKQSPGMCIIDRDTGACHTIAFTDLKKYQQAAFVKDLKTNRHMKTTDQLCLGYSIDLIALPTSKTKTKAKAKTKENKENKEAKEAENHAGVVEIEAKQTTKNHTTIHHYHFVTEALLSVLKRFKTNQLYVIMEGYSFAKQRGRFGSSSVTGLAEITGILKCKLFAEGIVFDIVPPTTIKRWFTAHGGSQKGQMFAQFHNLQTGVNLDSLFPGRNQTSEKIPSPQQDLVDSFAIAYSLLTSQKILESENEGKARKRRKTTSSPTKN